MDCLQEFRASVQWVAHIATLETTTGGGGGNETKTSSPSFAVFHDATNSNYFKKAEKHLPPAKDNLYSTEMVMLCLGLPILVSYPDS